GVEHDDLSKRMFTLPPALRQRLAELVMESINLQVAYNTAAVTGATSTDETKRLITRMPFDPEAAELFETNRKALGVFKRGIQDHRLDYPDTYIMFSRINMLSQRIAAQIAHFNRAPAITREVLSW